MRKILAFGTLLALMVIVTNQADAQRPGGGFGGGGGALMFLANKGVQEELKISPEQKEKIESLNKDYGFGGTKSREVFTKFKDLPQEERREKMQQAMKEINESVLKELALTPTQSKRLKQIERQQNVMSTLTSDEEVGKELKLTDEQKEKIKGINETLTKDLEPLGGGGRTKGAKGGGGFNKENMEKRTALRTEASDKAVKLLTPDQLGKWKELTGEPFKFEFTGGGGRNRPKTKEKE